MRGPCLPLVIGWQRGGSGDGAPLVFFQPWTHSCALRSAVLFLRRSGAEWSATRHTCTPNDSLAISDKPPTRWLWCNARNRSPFLDVLFLFLSLRLLHAHTHTHSLHLFFHLLSSFCSTQYTSFLYPSFIFFLSLFLYLSFFVKCTNSLSLLWVLCSVRDCTDDECKVE